jgi:hypothetical protein
LSPIVFNDTKANDFLRGLLERTNEFSAVLGNFMSKIYNFAEQTQRIIVFKKKLESYLAVLIEEDCFLCSIILIGSRNKKNHLLDPNFIFCGLYVNRNCDILILLGQQSKQNRQK